MNRVKQIKKQSKKEERYSIYLKSQYSWAKQIIFDFLDFINIRANFVYPKPWQKLGLNKHLKGRELTGVEVGVFKGRHSKCILEKSMVKKLYCVDPYLPYFGYDITKCEEMAHKRLSKFGNKVVWIKKKSLNASKDIPNELDFVYLDGDHSYEYVKKELELYYPKLKKGGVLAGDDFYNLDAKDNYMNVAQAVMEFAVKNKLELFIWSPDFWMFKE